MADSDDGYRSRSQSRRRRRQNQRQRQAASKAEGGGGTADSMTAVQEEDEGLHTRLNNPATQDTTEMQPFEHIKPPSQSMDGPVTYARAQRGEIPMRGGGQLENMPQKQDKSSDILAQDGLKLRLELNLDIEVELKASIHGDLTLAIMS
jgi:hypothetical protein